MCQSQRKYLPINLINSTILQLFLFKFKNIMKRVEIYIPIEFRIIDAVKDRRDKPHNKCKNDQIQNIVDHHDVEAVLLVVVVHPCEKRV